MVRTHQLHLLDEDDPRLEGERILLHVHPTILAFGSKIAEHYNQHEVWSPAVVAMHEQESLGCVAIISFAEQPCLVLLHPFILI
jgi:hypothetical protein